MERELWIRLYRLAKACDKPQWWKITRYGDFQIVAVYLWAVLHDRPTSWACQKRNWPTGLWPDRQLPAQSTMSRRLRTTEVQRLLVVMEATLKQFQKPEWVSVVDGKPLVVGPHSKDHNAQWGWASRSYAKGYELEAVYGSGPLPWQWEIVPLNVAESDVAARLIPALDGAGYLLGDSHYDSNPLHEIAGEFGYQLLAPRKRPRAGLGHRQHHPGRLRSIELLEKDFGQGVYAWRDHIERQFGWLTSHAAGLSPLPSWVRGWHRVNRWVQAKLLIHAVYVSLEHSPPLPASA